MAKARLTALKARKLKHSGRTRYGESHGDEHGLVLLVQPTGGKSWVQRVTLRAGLFRANAHRRRGAAKRM